MAARRKRLAMKIRITYDRIIGLVLLVFSLALLFWIIPYGVEQMGGDVGPGMDPTAMPKYTGLLLGFLAILVMAARIPGQEKRVRLFPVRTIITIAFFVAYMVLTPLIGYLPASLVVLPVYLVFFGARDWKVIIPLSIGLPVLLYLFFAKVMLVILPTGLFMN